MTFKKTKLLKLKVKLQMGFAINFENFFNHLVQNYRVEHYIYNKVLDYKNVERNKTASNPILKINASIVNNNFYQFF